MRRARGWLAASFVVPLLVAPALGQPSQSPQPQSAKPITAEQLKQKIDRREKMLIIDVREDDEVKSGSIPGAIHIRMDELEARMKDIPKNVHLVLACPTGGRSARAAELFQKKGYQTTSFCALNEWKGKQYKLETPKKPGPGPITPAG